MDPALPNWLISLGNLLNALLQLFLALWGLIYSQLPILLWIVFWFCCVNWKKLWPVLAQGAWVPVLLLVFITAEAWSRISQGDFWWRLGSVCVLAAVALVCGWLQTISGWTPPEMRLEPQAIAPGHGHGHGHAHEQNHHAGHH